MTKTIATKETGFDFNPTAPNAQICKGIFYKYINGTLFYAYDLGRFDIYARIEAEKMKYAEITKELFYTIINSGDKTTEVINTSVYTDVVYNKHGVKLMVRTQNGYYNYYVQDINA